jgi:hypothetical protein
MDGIFLTPFSTIRAPFSLIIEKAMRELSHLLIYVHVVRENP